MNGHRLGSGAFPRPFSRCRMHRQGCNSMTFVRRRRSHRLQSDRDNLPRRPIARLTPLVESCAREFKYSTAIQFSSRSSWKCFPSPGVVAGHQGFLRRLRDDAVYPLTIGDHAACDKCNAENYVRASGATPICKNSQGFSIRDPKRDSWQYRHIGTPKSNWLRRALLESHDVTSLFLTAHR
jgi:hypothetical protein